MTDPAVVARAEELATKSLEYFSASRQNDAVRALREALTLAPQNPTVLAAFSVLQKDANVPVVSKLVHRFAKDGDEQAGKEALQMLRDPNASVQTSTGSEIVEVLLPHRSDEKRRAQAAKIIPEVLRISRGTREHVADKLAGDTKGTVAAFEELGEEGVDALVGVLLDQMAWTKAAANVTCLRECFKVWLGELKAGSPAGVGRQCIARAVARLLTGKPEELGSLVNQEGLEQLLGLTDLSLPIDLRSHATLAVAKFVETSEETARSMIEKFVGSRLGNDEDDDLRVVFSMAAALFPVVPQVMSQLFLSNGFVEGLVEMLQARPVEVEAAALEMLSCACVEKTCRTAIANHCTPYLESLVRSNAPGQSTAAVVLAKVKYGAADEAQGQPSEAKDMDELAGVFKELMLKGDSGSMDSSVEGLAYTSLKGSVKASIVKNPKIVKGLIDTLKSSTGKPTVMFGALTVLANLTAYRPVLTEEQKKISELKSYAEAKGGRTRDPDPEDADAFVTARCKTLLDAGVIPALVSCSKKITPNAIALISSILLSLSKEQKHRGTIASQGGVKLCIQFFSTTSADPKLDRTIKHTSAHALARTLVSVNPSHVFSSALTTTTPVRPLLTLLDDPDDKPDLLPVFEALLALTNLASADEAVRSLILRLNFPKIEDLLLSPNTHIQRAACELICNLMASPHGLALYADGSPAARSRLHILLALADAEDLPTRKAAGGALAMVTEFEGAARAVVARDGGVRRVLAMCEEDEEEMRHRGVVVVHNLVCGEAGLAREVKAGGGEDVLLRVAQATKMPNILGAAVEVLKKLKECGA